MRLLIRAGNAAVGVDGASLVAPDGTAFDLVLDCPDAELRPGLINAHEHLHRNHYGRLGRPPYANAYDWAEDIQRRDAGLIADRRTRPRRDALLEGAWKNLFAGVTTVVHHDPWEAAFERDFPLRVARVQSADSLGMAPVEDLDPTRPYCLHLAEGVDATARAETMILDGMGLLGPRLIAVHGVGLADATIDRFRASGAALVWCPSSNLFLFGATAPERLLAEGIDLLLGSDSLLTGAGDLLDELRIARATRLVGDRRLDDAVCATAARRLDLPTPSLVPGAPADLILLTRPLSGATAADVALVLVDGAPRVVRPDLAAHLASHLPAGREMRRGDQRRWTPAAPAPALWAAA